MCPAQGPQRSDAGETQTCGPSVSSQALNIEAFDVMLNIGDVMARFIFGNQKNKLCVLM